MNRRDFTVNVAGAALGAAAFGKPSLSGAGAPGMATAAGEAPGVPFHLSVMLWTVFQKLPFEQRLEKVAEAGYKNVELVGEYHQEKWSEEKFTSVNKKRRELGINFDTTAGLQHGVGNPAERHALLANLRDELKIMEKIECPAVIVMSGNVVHGLGREQ